MAVITREPMAQSFIANTTMEKIYRDGVHRQYGIYPCENYVLHTTTLDIEEIDLNTGMLTGNIIKGYTPMGVTCSVNYDFEANPDEYYAVLASTVPADQIFGGGNDHKTILKNMEVI